LGSDEGIWWKVQQKVPAAWATLEEDIDCDEPRVKITLRVDASVARVFRAMGKGYQARMNRVLATYAQMRIGEVEREAEALSAMLERYGPEISAELEAAYRRLRPHLEADGDEDVAWWDRVLGVGPAERRPGTG